MHGGASACSSMSWATTMSAAKDVAMHMAAMKPKSLVVREVRRDLIDKERKIAIEKAAEAGKPMPMIVAKMVEGSVQKFLKEVSLLDQVFVKAADGKQTVEQLLKAKSAPSPASRFTWWARASRRRRRMTLPPKWLHRQPLR
jgi:translation elongation factor EF-Ts